MRVVRLRAVGTIAAHLLDRFPENSFLGDALRDLYRELWLADPACFLAEARAALLARGLSVEDVAVFDR
jgi:hypothetical protein